MKIIEKPHSFVPRPLIFKLQQDVLKFNELELPKNWPSDTFFKSKFWERQFFSIVTFIALK